MQARRIQEDRLTYPGIGKARVVTAGVTGSIRNDILNTTLIANQDVAGSWTASPAAGFSIVSVAGGILPLGPPGRHAIRFARLMTMLVNLRMALTPA